MAKQNNNKENLMSGQASGYSSPNGLIHMDVKNRRGEIRAHAPPMKLNVLCNMVRKKTRVCTAPVGWHEQLHTL